MSYHKRYIKAKVDFVDLRLALSHPRDASSVTEKMTMVNEQNISGWRVYAKPIIDQHTTLATGFALRIFEPANYNVVENILTVLSWRLYMNGIEFETSPKFCEAQISVNVHSKTDDQKSFTRDLFASNLDELLYALAQDATHAKFKRNLNEPESPKVILGCCFEELENFRFRELSSAFSLTDSDQQEILPVFLRFCSQRHLDARNELIFQEVDIKTAAVEFKKQTDQALNELTKRWKLVQTPLSTADKRSWACHHSHSMAM